MLSTVKFILWINISIFLLILSIKLTIKSGKTQYEVAIGSAVIKIFKFIKN